MVFVHNCFRQQFGALPGLVRASRTATPTAPTVIVDFLAELTTSLHHHHEGEDELMWPLLLERAPMDSALILRMEEQHERIAELYQRAADNAAAFAATADPARSGGTCRHPDRAERRPGRAPARRGGAHPAAGRAGDDGRPSGRHSASAAGPASPRTASWSSSDSC